MLVHIRVVVVVVVVPVLLVFVLVPVPVLVVVGEGVWVKGYKKIIWFLSLSLSQVGWRQPKNGVHPILWFGLPNLSFVSPTFCAPSSANSCTRYYC